MPPGRILFNHMAPMAERPHPQNRSAARYVQNDYHYTSSVTNILKELKWSTLEQRRNQASLTMLHKIHNKQVNVDHSHLTTTRNNEFRLYNFETNY